MHACDDDDDDDVDSLTHMDGGRRRSRVVCCGIGMRGSMSAAAVVAVVLAVVGWTAAVPTDMYPVRTSHMVIFIADSFIIKASATYRHHHNTHHDTHSRTHTHTHTHLPAGSSQAGGFMQAARKWRRVLPHFQSYCSPRLANVNNDGVDDIVFCHGGEDVYEIGGIISGPSRNVAPIAAHTHHPARSQALLPSMGATEKSCGKQRPTWPPSA
jgi:hypothetical protein